MTVGDRSIFTVKVVNKKVLAAEPPELGHPVLGFPSPPCIDTSNPAPGVEAPRHPARACSGRLRGRKIGYMMLGDRRSLGHPRRTI